MPQRSPQLMLTLCVLVAGAVTLAGCSSDPQAPPSSSDPVDTLSPDPEEDAAPDGSQPDPDSESDSESDSEPDSESDSEPDSESDSEADSEPDSDAEPDVGPPLPTTCLSPTSADPSNTDALVDPQGLGTATLNLDDPDACYRSYILATSATLVDDLPESPRTIPELEGSPTLRSGHYLFDALYALALEETRENSVEVVNNGAFNNNQAVPCGEGGCFETGRKWTYVWTRDTAYAMHLGLASLDPIRARNSLLFKVSERRGGGDLQIVQDTGSGGSYPVSSDRVSWALGARAVLAQLEGPERDAFAQTAYDALANTLEHDRQVVYDPADGLYRGEQSFLDWREQSYPLWTEHDVRDVAQSKSLSTNVLHLAAMRLAADLATELDQPQQAATYAAWADALKIAIRNRLWVPDDNLFATYVRGPLTPAPTRRYDLLGESLAVLLEVATEVDAKAILASYPHYGPGAPVIWPQQQLTRIYHNRGEWPFVTAYWLRAARAANNAAVGAKMVDALVRGAAINLSNMENFEAGSGAAFFDDGPYSGPVVNSQRQLWSVAAYVSMVQHTLFGAHPGLSGLTIAPWLPAATRDALFAGSSELVLNDLPYRGATVTIVLHLPDTTGQAGALTATKIALDGVDQPGLTLAADLLTDAHRVDVTMQLTPADDAITQVSDADWKSVFSPRTPRVAGLEYVDGTLDVGLFVSEDEIPDVTIDIYRDGELVAAALPGSTTLWPDAGSTPDSVSHCYYVETRFTASGNRSQQSREYCWWGSDGERIQIVEATAFDAVGGELVDNHGRWHYQSWGEPGHSLTIDDLSPATTGPHYIELRYGNGAGPISTGITCAVKRVRVFDAADDTLVHTGYFAMPHFSNWSKWGLSNLVPVDLDAGKTYRVVLDSDAVAVNMSAFEHFAAYTGGEGGVDGPYNFVNIAELRLLKR